MKSSQNPRFSSFLDNFLYKILGFIANKEVAQIIREIIAAEAEISKMSQNKGFLEKNLNNFEIEYKSKLKGCSNESLLDLRRIIDKKREEFQQVIFAIKDANLRKAQLIEDFELHAKMARRDSPFSSKNRSFERKGKKTEFFSKNRSFEVKDKKYGNFENSAKKRENLNLSCNFPNERSSFYETFKLMKKGFVSEKLKENQLNFNQTTIKPSVIFSPTNETNARLAMLIESDQKDLEEKFGLSRK